MVFDTAAGGILFLLARVLFGGVLAFMGLNHFQNGETMAGYAEAKGLPAPELAVYASGGLLVFSGLSIVLGAFPVLAAGALATFLLVSAVTMHDFWAVPEDQQQDELTGFLKNVAMAGGALVLLSAAGTAWPYSVGLALF
ncbi:DoxX family protein [Haloarcula litorea]|uniref:DoxX family protein n=1 Tax=Haloarcula litorea TaxID=3032579 RepID=UPI0023E836F6|nr:DoxX family protein [Halomicroarcula sp. GDY20]